MNTIDLSTYKRYPNKKPIIKMTSWMRNTISKLYQAVSAIVEATRDALAERLQSIRESASLIYSRMMDNIVY